LYDLFGRYGAIRQVRIGTAKDTQGTAFVVFEDIYDAKKVSAFLQLFSFLFLLSSINLLGV
jgi:pre-mRNA branch site protein p14